MYSFLDEALEAWVNDHTLKSRLVGRLGKEGEISYGLDEENDVCYWVVDGTRYSVKHNTGGGFTSDLAANPLLPPLRESGGSPQDTSALREVSPTKRRSTRH